MGTLRDARPTNKTTTLIMKSSVQMGREICPSEMVLAGQAGRAKGRVKTTLELLLEVFLALSPSSLLNHCPSWQADRWLENVHQMLSLPTLCAWLSSLAYALRPHFVHLSPNYKVPSQEPDLVNPVISLDPGDLASNLTMLPAMCT